MSDDSVGGIWGPGLIYQPVGEMAHRSPADTAWRVESMEREDEGEKMRFKLVCSLAETVDADGTVLSTVGKAYEVVITRRQAREFLRFIDQRI